MANKFNYITLVLTLCMLLTACGDQDVSVVDTIITETDKTPIELSVGGIEGESNASTRAVITDGTNKTMQSFSTKHDIFFVLRSEKDTDASHGEYEFTGDRGTTLYTVCRGYVEAGSNKVKFYDNNQRYWDDAHARSSKLTIWAYAQDQNGKNWPTATFTSPDTEIPGNVLGKAELFNTNQLVPWDVNATYPWRAGDIYPCIFSWNVVNPEATAEASLITQDLKFSNNLADNHRDGLGGTDNSRKFNFNTHKFPTDNNMIFYHALSRITIRLKYGAGFNGETDFKFTEGGGQNLHLNGFNTRGLFNIKTGGFETIHDHVTELNKLYYTTPKSADAYYELVAQVIPNIHEFMKGHGYSDTYSRFDENGTATMMEFSIDNNSYKISSGMLYNALKNLEVGPSTNQIKKETDNTVSYIPLEAGKHYIFTFTVGKTKIEHLMAELADWETVTSSQITPSNAHVDIDLEERGDQLSTTDVLDLYRATKTSTGIAATDFIDYGWETGYDVGHKNTYSYEGSVWKLASDWYWPNNKTYYHLRGILPGGTVVETDATNGDYVVLASGKVSGGDAYKDVRWAAPMRDDANNETPGSFKWKYDLDNGFSLINSSLGNKNQIHEAIGATDGKLKFTLFHMMSEIKVTLTASGTNVPALSKTENGETTYATVELLNFKDGKLLLGNGSVQTTGDTKTQSLPKADATYDYLYGIVPQALSDDVKLRIKTADDNVYYVDLNKVVTDAGHIGNSNLDNPYTVTAGNCTIDKWYPGFKYEYTINLTLKGIDKVGVKLVDWKDVTMDEEGIQIK